MASSTRDTTLASARPASRADSVAEAFASYRLEARLGRGNRATVYRAVHRKDGKIVALRVFDRQLTAEPTFATQLGEVVAALSSCHHPGLLPILSHGVHDGWAYLVRPYVVGENLRQRLGTPLPLDEALRLLRPVAAALDHAHAAGVVHGDLKPGNILLPASGQVAITDAGIAGLLPRGNTLLSAATGRYYGTPEYLAPEQAHGLTPDGHADIYALGVILYEALTGQPPFRGATPRLIVAQHISAPPPAFGDQHPDLGAAVEPIVLRALAKEPARRFPTAGAFLIALEAVAGGALSTRAFVPDDLGATMPLLRDVSQPLTALLPPPQPDGAARHAAELAQLRADYEARLAADAERARGREAALSAQLAAMREETAARTEAAAALARERDVLAARVRELEGAGRAAIVPAPPRPGGCLVLLDAERAGLVDGAAFPLTPDAVLGRHPDCAIHLADDFISGQHARLTWEAGAWWLVDLGTLNGTLVNGERIKRPTQLRDGDVVRLGRTHARVALDSPPVAGGAGRASRER
jgi:hypothetical protein